MNLVTDLTLNSDSIIWAFLDRSYPYGAFNVRKNTVKIFVDKQNRNFLFPKFSVDVKLFKEGEQVVNLEMDTTNKPYRFLFVAPNVFKRWNIKYDKIEATLAHDIGSSLNFKTNVAGGIQMMKINIHTEKDESDGNLRIKLNDLVEVDADSLLFRKVVNNYSFLTPFKKRVGEYEIFINKQERNVLFSKFHVRGKVTKDGERVMQLNIATDEKPYKVELYMPVVLNRIYSDMDEYKMSIDHNPGQSLEIKTNGKKFKSFKIARTGNNNERIVEISGKQLASGDYTLTDTSFTTKMTDANGDWIQPSITWEGDYTLTDTSFTTKM